MDKLIIDPEFRDKIPPLMEEEFTLLEDRMGRSFHPSLSGTTPFWTVTTAMRSSRSTRN